MGYRVFLLERELGYQITWDMNGLALMERLNMLVRYWTDKNGNTNGGSSGGKTDKSKGLIK